MSPISRKGGDRKEKGIAKKTTPPESNQLGSHRPAPIVPAGGVRRAGESTSISLAINLWVIFLDTGILLDLFAENIVFHAKITLRGFHRYGLRNATELL